MMERLSFQGQDEEPGQRWLRLFEQFPRRIDEFGAGEMEMIYSNTYKSYPPVFKDR